MHGDGAHAVIAQFFYVGFRVGHHQMGVQLRVGVVPQQLYRVGAEGDAGAEIAVLDVQMQVTRGTDPGGLFTQRGQIAAGQRGQDQKHGEPP